MLTTFEFDEISIKNEIDLERLSYFNLGINMNKIISEHCIKEKYLLLE